MLKILPLFLVTILLFNCTNNQKPPENKAFVPEWDLVRIKVDKDEFWIPFNEDSSILVSQLPDSIKKNLKPNQETSISKKILIPQTEKDTIRMLVIEAITKPILTVKEVSCYA